MKNIAIIGLGKWGKVLLNEYAKISNVSICCTNGSKKNLKWLCKNYPKIQHTTNPNDIFYDRMIDAVIIATPIRTHGSLAIKALKAGKHVFVEKPLADTLSQSKKIITVAKKNNLVIFVGYVFSYHEIFKKIKTISKRENIIYARFDWAKQGTFDENILFNLLSHDIFLALELFGNPIRYSLLDDVGFATSSDILTLELQFEKNQRCIIVINRLSNYKKKTITIITTKNLYQWDGNFLFKFSKSKKMFRKIFQSKIMPLTLECKEFINEITKSKINHPPTNVLHTMEILSKITKQK